MTDLMIHELASQGEYRQIESLIRMGKVNDVDVADDEYGARTPLHLAASYASAGEDYRLVELQGFVSRGKFDINFKDEEWRNMTPLHCAAAKGHVRCCKILLENGANPLAVMDMGWTPAHCAAENGHLDVLQLLSKHGESVKARDSYGVTPCGIAEVYGFLECAQFLSSVENEPPSKVEESP